MAGTLGRWLLRLLVVVGLVVDAIVHLRLAHQYGLAQSGGVGEGTLFRIETGVALAVALWVLLRGSRAAYVAAAVVGFSALAVVLVYRYVNVPAFGPIPSMYEPVWFGQKVLTAAAEAVAGVAAVVAGLTTGGRRE
ncbi:MAG: hypothetical protein ACRDPH_02515 [Marmoricola sp.]